MQGPSASGFGYNDRDKFISCEKCVCDDWVKVKHLIKLYLNKVSFDKPMMLINDALFKSSLIKCLTLTQSSYTPFLQLMDLSLSFYPKPLALGPCIAFQKVHNIVSSIASLES